jgi:hypothetical protein
MADVGGVEATLLKFRAVPNQQLMRTNLKPSYLQFISVAVYHSGNSRYFPCFANIPPKTEGQQRTEIPYEIFSEALHI